MGRKKWMEKILFVLEILAAMIFAGLSFWMLWHYIEYNGNAAVETSALGKKTTDMVEPGTSGKKKTNDVQNETEEPSGHKKQEEGSAIRAEISVPENICVTIMDQDFQHEYHETVVLSCDKGYAVSEMGGTDSEKKEYAPEETFTISASELPEGTILCVSGNKNGALKVESITRGDGTPQYRGKLYLEGTEDGILVVNELPLEEYLCGVVSSEMPSDYPEEALKAQAVCARTYAVNCIPVRDMNDSVSFQVYNNYRSQKASREAVAATTGEILPLDEVLYFSTSCLSEHREDLGDEGAFEKFLKEEPEEGKEYGSPWLRWTVELPVRMVVENCIREFGEDVKELKKKAEAAEGEEEIFSVRITGRRNDGQIQAVSISCYGEHFSVEGEYQIRKLFGDRDLEILLQDGTLTSNMQLLPSAYFYLEGESFKLDDSISIVGGGYGHGNGMSQCGAAQMASEGLDYHAILRYYYGVDTIVGKDT